MGWATESYNSKKQAENQNDSELALGKNIIELIEVALNRCRQIALDDVLLFAAGRFHLMRWYSLPADHSLNYLYFEARENGHLFPIH